MRKKSAFRRKCQLAQVTYIAGRCLLKYIECSSPTILLRMLIFCSGTMKMNHLTSIADSVPSASDQTFKIEIKNRNKSDD